MALIGALTDDFPGSTLNAQWSASGTGGSSGTLTVANNQLGLLSNASYSVIVSSATYDCTNGILSARAVAPSVGDLTELEFKIGLCDTTAGTTNAFTFGCTDGTLYGTIRTAGSAVNYGSTTYNATTHKWLRIRFVGTTVNFDYSPDGSNWTNYVSQTTSITLTALYARIFAGYDDASSGTAYIARVNLGSIYISALTDNFPGSSLAAQWTVVSGSPTVASNQVTVPATTGYTVVGSTRSYDCTGGTFLMKVPGWPATGLAQLEQGIYLSSVQAGFSGAVNGIQIYNYHGLLLAVIDVAGTQTTLGTSLTFQPGVAAWLRVRFTSSTVYADYGPDGHTWVNLGSSSYSFDITALYAGFFAGYDASEPAANGIFAKANLPTVAPSAAPQFASTALVGSATVPATNDTSLTAPTNTVTVVNAGGGGARIDNVRILGLGTTVAGRLNLFRYDNTTYHLVDQIEISAVTPGASQQVFEQVNSYKKLALNSGESLVATVMETGNESLLKVTAMGGVPGFIKGVSPGDVTGVAAATLATEFAATKAAGAQYERLDIFWSQVQSTNATTYSWTLPDKTIGAALTAGLKVIAIINGDALPSWATSPANAAQFATFCTQAVIRYSAMGVHIYEVFNEPNLAANWGGTAASASQFTTVLQSAYVAIKNADPLAFVISGGLSPASTSGGNITPLDFITQMYAAGAQGSFDAFGMHPYCYALDPQTASPSSTFYNLPLIYATMVNNGDGAKQIWMTEFGVPSNFSGESTALQATQLASAVTQLANWAWAGPMMWHCWKDGEGGDTLNFGLVDSSNAHKLVYPVYLNT